MRSAIIVMALLFSASAALGKEICATENGKTVCYRNPDVDLNGPYQQRYDEDMKSSGKWGLVSSTFYLTSVVGLGATYYSLSRFQRLEDQKRQRLLTPDEEKERRHWDNATKNAVAATVGSFLFGLIGHGFELHYERKAHSFAIETGVSW